jgi:hypothetical protein
MWRNIAIAWTSLAFLAAPGSAKPKPKAAAKASKETARAIDELQGKFKWGMTTDETKKLISDELRKQHEEEWKKAVGNPYEQDKISQEIRDGVAKIEKSYIEFKGQKTPWEVSLIDREFAHGNSEAMLVIEEGQKRQRRFLFYYQGRLYKQMIAFDKDLFEGKNFDQFAALIQNRYGRGIAKYSLNRKGEQVLEHLEWPPSGTSLLRAVDQSNFYDTFCLVVEDRQVSQQIAPRHKENASGVATTIVKEIQAPQKVQGDANADIVDRITGRGKAASSSEEPTNLTSEPAKLGASAAPAAETAPTPAPAAEPKKAAPAKKKDSKDGKKLDDLEL